MLEPEPSYARRPDHVLEAEDLFVVTYKVLLGALSKLDVDTVLKELADDAQSPVSA